ncbi:MAG: hotdog fold thioesterase [Candidatus Neomarinimicrobiota bacterium]
MKKAEILEEIIAQSQNSLVGHLGIEITDFDDKSISGRMPVDQRTKHPLGRLHGGASVAFAETLGSIGATFKIDFPNEIIVGLTVNANHLKSVSTGWVYGKAVPVHVGKATQVWNIKISNDNAELVCNCQLTVAIVKSKSKASSGK